jgi:hypothetical protein
MLPAVLHINKYMWFMLYQFFKINIILIPILRFVSAGQQQIIFLCFVVPSRCVVILGGGRSIQPKQIICWPNRSAMRTTF